MPWILTNTTGRHLKKLLKLYLGIILKLKVKNKRSHRVWSIECTNAELLNGFFVSLGAKVISFDTDLDVSRIEVLMHAYGYVQIQ